MSTVNEKDFSTEVKEFLTFNSDVLKVYNKLKDIFVEGDDEEPEIYNFLHHKLTDDDKIEILTLLTEKQEKNKSIFNHKLIKNVLIDWIDEKFGVLI